jgi:thiosulfate reductase cytochrome b subunit
MTLDPKRAVALLVQQREFIKPSEVVSQLQKAENNSTYRYLLHEYLHALFEKDPHAGKDFHGLQVIYFVGKLNILIIILIYGILFLANIYKEHFTNLTI